MKLCRFAFLGAVVATLLASGMAQAQLTITESFQTEFFEDTIVPGKVSISMTDHEGTAITPHVDVEVPGLVSYVGRPKFDARTGGANATQDVGPLSFSYDDGGTITNVDYPIDPLPPVFTNTVGAEPALNGDGFIRVASNTNSLTNNVAWDTAYTGNFDTMTANFQIRLQAGGAANDNADGFGFMYANTDPHGDTGAFYTAGEEPSGTGLGVGFDIWDNGTEGGNSVSLHYNGSLISSVDVTGLSPNREAYLESGEPIDVQIVAVAGSGSAPDPVLQPMSTFNTSVTRSPNNGGLMPVRDMDNGPGVDDAYFRLTNDINDQGNYMTWDAVSAEAGSRPGFGARTGGANQKADVDGINVVYDYGKVDATFDFRISKEGDPADGMSFVLARTGTYGQTGVVDRLSDGEGIGWEVAEDPALVDGFGVGFKTFDADELRIRNNGEVVANLGPETLPDSFVNDTFVDGNWHTANIVLTDIPGTLDADVVISLDGVQVFSGPVTGAGGLGLVPEPSSLSLLALGMLGGLNAARRRRR